LEISADGNGTILAKTRNALSAYDQDTGSLVWTVSIGNQRESFPAVIAGERVFVSDKKQLWAFDLKTGKELWKSPLTSADTWVPAASNKYVLLNSISDHIDVYDAESGVKLWGIPGGRGYTQAYIDDNTIYVVDRGVKALDAITGDILWELDNHRATGFSTFGNGILYYMEYPGDNTFDLNVYVLELFSRIIHTLNIENGNELGSLQIAPQRILGTETQEMVSIGTNLVFSRGCEVFVYGD